MIWKKSLLAEDANRLTLSTTRTISFISFQRLSVSTSILAQQTFRFSTGQLLADLAFMKKFFKFEFVYDNELSTKS